MPRAHGKELGLDLFDRLENDFDALFEPWDICLGELLDGRQIDTKVFVNQHIT
jgi:hypothetical protein